MLSDFSPSGVEHVSLDFTALNALAGCFQISRLRALSTPQSGFSQSTQRLCFQISRLRALSTPAHAALPSCNRLCFQISRLRALSTVRCSTDAYLYSCMLSDFSPSGVEHRGKACFDSKDLAMLSDFSPSGVEHSHVPVAAIFWSLMLSDFSPSGVEHSATV